MCMNLSLYYSMAPGMYNHSFESVPRLWWYIPASFVQQLHMYMYLDVFDLSFLASSPAPCLLERGLVLNVCALLHKWLKDSYLCRQFTVCLMRSCFIAERISARLWMRDLFSQCTCVGTCTYIRTCQSRSGMPICTHLHSRARNSCITCMMMEACAGETRGQGRMAFLDNGGRGGQRGCSSTMYVFCGVECWMQPTVGDAEKQNAMYKRSQVQEGKREEGKLQRKKARCGESSQARYKRCSLSCSIQP